MLLHRFRTFPLTLLAVVFAFAMLFSACSGSDDAADAGGDTPAAEATASANGSSDAATEGGSTGDGGADDGSDNSADDDDGGIALNTGATGDADSEDAEPGPEDTTVGADGLTQGEGVTDDAIRIGFILNDADPETAPFLFAQTAYWNAVNASGGIAGRTVEWQVESSDGSVAAHRRAISDMSGGSSAVVMIGGIDSLEGTVGATATLTRENLVALPLTSWSGWSDPADGVNLLEVQASDCAQNINIMSYLADRSGDTVAVVSSPGQPWADGAAGAFVAISHDELELVHDGRNKLVSVDDMDALVTDVVNSAADAVWLGTDTARAIAFMTALRDAGYRGDFGGMAQSYDPQLLADHSELLTGYILATPYTSWGDNAESGMTALMAALEDENPFAEVNDGHVRSWVYAKATHQALLRAADASTLTRKGIVEVTETLRVENEALAPNQAWLADEDALGGNSVSTYMYEPELTYETATVSSADASGGFKLRKGPFASDAALAWSPKTCSPAG